MHRAFAFVLASVALTHVSIAAASLGGGLIGFGKETIYCKFHGGGKFRVLTTYGLDSPETQSTQTTMWLLAEMAMAKNLTHFRIKKAKCGTLFINRAMRSRQCLLIAEPAADGSSTTYDSPVSGTAFAVSDVLSKTKGSTLPLPETRGLVGSQSDCRVSDSGELTIRG